MIMEGKLYQLIKIGAETKVGNMWVNTVEIKR